MWYSVPQDRRSFLPFVKFYCCAVYNILSLVLVNGINKIRISKEVNIDHSVIGQIFMLYLFHHFHVIIIKTNKTLVSDVFINKVMVSHFPDYLEVHYS